MYSCEAEHSHELSFPQGAHFSNGEQSQNRANMQCASADPLLLLQQCSQGHTCLLAWADWTSEQCADTVCRVLAAHSRTLANSQCYAEP